MTAHAVSHVYFGLNPMSLSTGILAVTYAIVMSEKVNRAVITLVGASANLTVAGLAKRGGVPFRFITDTLYATPLTLVSIAIAHVYVWWRFFLALDGFDRGVGQRQRRGQARRLDAEKMDEAR